MVHGAAGARGMGGGGVGVLVLITHKRSRSAKTAVHNVFFYKGRQRTNKGPAVRRKNGFMATFLSSDSEMERDSSETKEPPLKTVSTKCCCIFISDKQRDVRTPPRTPLPPQRDAPGRAQCRCTENRGWRGAAAAPEGRIWPPTAPTCSTHGGSRAAPRPAAREAVLGGGPGPREWPPCGGSSRATGGSGKRLHCLSQRSGCLSTVACAAAHRSRVQRPGDSTQPACPACCYV